WSQDDARIWSIVALAMVVSVVPLAILELMGIMDDKGRKFPSALSLGVALLMLFPVGLLVAKNLGVGVLRQAPLAPQNHPPLIVEKEGFRLDWPGEGWILISAEEMRKKGIAAAAGASNPSQGVDGFVAIIPEEPDLEELAQKFIDIARLGNKQ